MCPMFMAMCVCKALLSRTEKIRIRTCCRSRPGTAAEPASLRGCCMHARTHTCLHGRTDGRTHARTDRYTQPRTHAQPCTLASMHASTHARKHARTCMHGPVGVGVLPASGRADAGFGAGVDLVQALAGAGFLAHPSPTACMPADRHHISHRKQQRPVELQIASSRKWPVAGRWAGR